jgi:uncharacterized phage infection (PIP) family protein YhgE
MPGVVRWNPYKVGELRDKILRELNAIASGKDYRRKKGLESGAIREVKSNPHWQLYATIELFEMFSKRVDDVFKNTYMGTIQGLNESSNNIRGLAQQLQTAEYNINNTSTVAANNIIKGLKDEATRLNKVQQSLNKLTTDTKKQTDAVSSDLRKVASLFKKTMAENFDTFKNELQEDLGNLSRELTEESKSINEQVEGMSNNINEMGSKMDNFREVTTNVMDEHQNAIASELKDAIATMRKNLDENTDNLTSLFNSTNEHLDKIDESIGVKLASTHEDIQKDLQREVAELRTSLSTIRSDIELMKSVLTKLDNR